MRVFIAFLIGACLASTAVAGGAAKPETDAVPLDRHEVIDLVFDKTLECRKEKDQSLCANYLSDAGVVVRVMTADGARKEGVWFVDDKDRLCILWKGTLKPLCFSVYEQDDGTYGLYKKGKLITTLLTIEPGNPKGL